MATTRRALVFACLLAAATLTTACNDATGPSSSAACESQGSNTCAR